MEQEMPLLEVKDLQVRVDEQVCNVRIEPTPSAAALGEWRFQVRDGERAVTMTLTADATASGEISAVIVTPVDLASGDFSSPQPRDAAHIQSINLRTLCE